VLLIYCSLAIIIIIIIIITIIIIIIIVVVVVIIIIVTFVFFHHRCRRVRMWLQTCNDAILRYNASTQLWSGLLSLLCLAYIGALLGAYRVRTTPACATISRRAATILSRRQ
jgi:fatty acid desaturase